MGKECNGSGKSKLCAIKVPHKHCVCGEPIRRSTNECHFCRNEMAGISIHNANDYIRESMDHTSDDYDRRTDYIGYSPFKRGEDIFQFGFTDVITQREIDQKAWDAKQRASEQPFEPTLDHLE